MTPLSCRELAGDSTAADGVTQTDIIGWCFAACFFLEVVLRAYCVGLRQYFTSPLCLVDVCCTLADIVYIVGVEAYGWDLSSSGAG